MAGFSLGGNKLNQQTSDELIPPESLFLYHSGGGSGHRTEEVKGFEIWQQQQQQQQRPHHHHQLHLYPGATGGLGIFGDNTLVGGVAGPSSVAIGSSSGGRGIRGSGGGISCQDCGNQAKKDCMHMRCRTCCKSRNFQCATHVKSTWVPAAKRRERHEQLATATQQQQQHSSALLRGGGSGDASKRPREITTYVRPRLANTASSSGDGREVAAGILPSEVSSPAVFRCVRVSAITDADEQYAYETSVSIGGHIFKGILFDQGLESSSHYSATGGIGGTSALAVIGNTTTATTTTAVASSVMNNTSPTFYPTPINTFFSGTQFFPNPRP